MIGYINKYLKTLDYTYITCIKKIKSIFSLIFSIHKFRFNFFYMPFFIYKINKKLTIYIYSLYKYILYKYKKIKYTIFNYPKYYKNFNFYNHIKDTIKNDIHFILDYYWNIINIDLWKNNILFYILLLWFYSILLISNMLLYFLIIKFIFYSLKYILNYMFICLDYIFYTYLNFTRMPKFIFGIPYIIIIINSYRFYYILFHILPSLLVFDTWLYIIYNLKIIFIIIINRFLDILEYSIISFSKSFFFFFIKKLLYHIYYYLTEKDALKKFLIHNIINIKIYYKNKIKYKFFLFLNTKIICYFFFTCNNFKDKKNLHKRFIEFKTYIKYIYPYISFSFNFYVKFLIYKLNIFNIQFKYIHDIFILYMIFKYNKNNLNFNIIFIIKYHLINTILKYKAILYNMILYFYNIIFLSFWHYILIIIKYQTFTKK